MSKKSKNRGKKLEKRLRRSDNYLLVSGHRGDGVLVCTGGNLEQNFMEVTAMMMFSILEPDRRRHLQSMMAFYMESDVETVQEAAATMYWKGGA